MMEEEASACLARSLINGDGFSEDAWVQRQQDMASQGISVAGLQPLKALMGMS